MLQLNRIFFKHKVNNLTHSKDITNCFQVEAVEEEAVVDQYLAVQGIHLSDNFSTQQSMTYNIFVVVDVIV